MNQEDLRAIKRSEKLRRKRKKEKIKRENPDKSKQTKLT